MPQPTASQVHIDVALTNVSVAYLQGSDDYIANRIFPAIPSNNQSDKYFIYRKADWFRNVATKRGPASESSGGGYNIDQDNFYCEVYAHHYDLDAQVRANADTPLAMDRDATLWVTQVLAIKREVDWFSTFFTTGLWIGSTSGSDITPSTKWDAASGSTPIEDIEAQQFNMKKLTAKWPNRLVLGTSAWKALKNNTEIVDRYRYVQPGNITPALVAAVLSPPGNPEEASPNFEIHVATAIENTGVEGAASDPAMSFIGTATDALLCYSEPNPGILRPSAGYTFVWTPVAGYEARIKQIPMPTKGTDANGNPTMRIEGELSYAQKVVDANLGVYFSAATS